MNGPKCDYCSYNKPEGLVRCVDCLRYFCNGTFYGPLQVTGKASRSHAVQHASHVKHVSFLFYGPTVSGPAWDIQKCCARPNCQQDNIFELGAVGDRSVPGGLGIVCRSHAGAENLINRHLWNPLVSSKGKTFAAINPALCPWDEIVAHSSAQTPWGLDSGEKWDVGFCRLLEEYNLLFGKKKRKKAHFQEWRKSVLSGSSRVPTSQVNYVNHFTHLVQTLDDIEGALVLNLPPLHVAEILQSVYTQFKIKVPFGIYRDLLSNGCPINLLNDAGAVMLGFIAHVSEDHWGNILDIDPARGEKNRLQQFGVPVALKIAYYGVPSKRMKRALKLFPSAAALQAPLRHLLLNQPGQPNRCHEDEIEVFGDPYPNQWQIHAAELALTNRLTLIQGPPGTGKTETAALVIFNFYRFLQKGEQILCCAPSNHATDQLLLAIARRVPEGTKIVRLLARSKVYKGVPGVSQFTVRGLKGFPPGKRVSHGKYRNWELQCVRDADIICVTCNSAAMDVLQNRKFPYVLIDECNQALEPDSLIPITKGCNQLVLVGDGQQLGPVVKYQCLERTSLGTSLFARLSSYPQFQPGSDGQIMLREQYRMHSEIGKMISDISYRGLLEHSASNADRKLPRLEYVSGLNDNGAHPLLFVDVWHNDELSAGGDSYLNNKEAHIVTRIVANLLAKGKSSMFGPQLKPEQIGIVTFYRGQTRILLEEMRRHPELARDNNVDKIEINSIDGFQGREKDVIILSCVRSGGSGTFQQRAGFVDDPHRLNVSMSRAKCWLIAVGDYSVFSNKKVCDNWPKYLEYFRKSALHRRSAAPPRGNLDSVLQLPIRCGDTTGTCQFCQDTY
ncbi:regulator of nonsense transcripts 1 homolog [Paramacrobiotus metropolitanus]|uniref:regulator of nonsense transcripts 1 homolog n=1 Tax=Paramacrobiotus metropolitanus TaxID=2943436 RepID=UPI002446566F|nr:regulator of nonsense transcripts 1 homolog [Paramacrobiotus metropolitanus]